MRQENVPERRGSDWIAAAVAHQQPDSNRPSVESMLALEVRSSFLGTIVDMVNERPGGDLRSMGEGGRWKEP